MMLSLNNKFLRQKKNISKLYGKYFYWFIKFCGACKRAFPKQTKTLLLISSAQSLQRILNSVPVSV